MRWRRVFRGTRDQVRLARRFVAELVAGHPGSDDIITCASELAANAIRHTSSGRGGFFAVEVTWAGATVRVAVADGGAPTEPQWHQLSPGALDEAGRGLDIVTRLATSFGSEGDNRGRVVWAQFRPVTKTAPTAARLPLYPQPAVHAAAAALTRRYTGWHTWFGPWTRRWWALPKHPASTAALISEPTAAALAHRLDSLPRGHPMAPPGQARQPIYWSENYP